MTQTRPVGDPAAMADILASIRRIVAEEDRKFEHSPLRPALEGDVLVLTPEMRIDGPTVRAQATAAKAPDPLSAPAEAVPSAPTVGVAASGAPSPRPPTETGGAVALNEVELSADEAVMVDIARAVAQEEIERLRADALRPMIAEIVREEVARALRERN